MHFMHELRTVHDRHLEVGHNDLKNRLIQQAQRLLSATASLHYLAAIPPISCLYFIFSIRFYMVFTLDRDTGAKEERCLLRPFGL